MSRAARATTTTKSDAPGYKDRVAAVRKQRDRLMAEIVLLTKTQVSADSFVRKALTLLTVGWGPGVLASARGPSAFGGLAAEHGTYPARRMSCRRQGGIISYELVVRPAPPTALTKYPVRISSG